MEKYSFSLRIDNTEFSVGGDKDFVEENMKKWLSLFKDKLPEEILGKNDSSNHQSSSPQQASRTKLTITDFIKNKSPKTFNDLALTVFFYYERYEGLENVGVSIKHVEDFLNKLPQHPSSEELNTIIEQLLADGFIQVMQGTESNPKYQMTFTGEQCVKQGFNQ